MAETSVNPFAKGALTPRSPTRTRSAKITQQKSANKSDDIHVVIDKLNNLLRDILSIVNEEKGKLNTDQKLKINNCANGISTCFTHVVAEHGKMSAECARLEATNCILIKTASEHKDMLPPHVPNYQIEDLKAIKRELERLTTPPAESYAAKLKSAPTPLPRPAVVIYPSDSNASSDVTQTFVQECIKPNELKIQIRSLRKIRNGGVVIETNSKEDVEKLKESAPLKSKGYTIANPRKRLPRVIAYGVPNDTSEDEFIHNLYTLNIEGQLNNYSCQSFKEQVRMSHKSGRRDGLYCNWILEVPGDVRSLLVNQERAYIGWTSCPIKDFTSVTRCFNCQLYGHSAKYCKESKPICSHCAVFGHTKKECSSMDKPSVCASCTRLKKPADHITGEDSCPTKHRSIAHYNKSVNYDGA